MSDDKLPRVEVHKSDRDDTVVMLYVRLRQGRAVRGEDATAGEYPAYWYIGEDGKPVGLTIHTWWPDARAEGVTGPADG